VIKKASTQTPIKNKFEQMGQLIFTTHTTKLINQQELLWPDEIWLTEKKNGISKRYSINNFEA